MSLRAEVKGLFQKGSINFERLKIPFKERRIIKDEATQQRHIKWQTDMSRAFWLALTKNSGPRPNGLKKGEEQPSGRRTRNTDRKTRR